jgi:hypothetical protein
MPLIAGRTMTTNQIHELAGEMEASLHRAFQIATTITPHLVEDQLNTLVAVLCDLLEEAEEKRAQISKLTMPAELIAVADRFGGPLQRV